MVKPLEIGPARQRMHEARREYLIAKSKFIEATEAYEKIVDEWWREALEKSEKTHA